jgi:hypothetical protein
MADAGLIWVLDRMPNERFPYRVRVQRGDETLLALRAQDRWPAAGANYFCLRDKGSRQDDGADPPEEVERVPVVSFDRYGSRLAVVLDRPRYKRCDFLFLEKKSKSRPGERYEQIFWRTETALKARRTPSKLTLRQPAADLTVVVDSRELYGWRFPDCRVERRALAVGDYALLVDGKHVAVVERKTLDNLIAEFGRMPAFHQTLGELEKVPGHALVIEADYARVIDPKRWPAYSAAFRAQAIAEIFAFHPALRVVFAGNRKLANAWTRSYFAAWKERLEAERMPLFDAVVQPSEGLARAAGLTGRRP